MWKMQSEKEVAGCKKMYKGNKKMFAKLKNHQY